MSESSPYQDISGLTKTVLTILSEWQLQPEAQVAILGLPANTKPRALTRMQNHGTSPVSDEFLHRAKLILAIKNAVDSLYPFNGHAACLWITTPNLYFADRTPADIMAEFGLEGMQRVIKNLDGVGDW